MSESPFQRHARMRKITLPKPTMEGMEIAACGIALRLKELRKHPKPLHLSLPEWANRKP